MKIKDLLNIARFLGFSRDVSTAKEWVAEDYYKPTQKDKKSNQSSYSTESIKDMFSKFVSAGCKIFSVADTNSMEPLIDDNTPVVCEPLNNSRLQKKPLAIGQICLYEADWDDRLVIHQIVGVSSDGRFKFRGLNNFSNDSGWIKPDKIKYRVVAIGYGRQDEEGD